MNGQKLTLLDCAFKLLDDPRSPQDFTLILHFRKSPDLAGLQKGAQSARTHYPATGSVLERHTWVHRNGHLEEIPISAAPEAIAEFVNMPFDLRREYPVKQMLTANGSILATRFHHAAADGLSAALWLGHQLSVAYGLAPPENSAALSLRRQETSVRRSRFAYEHACDPLWTVNSTRSGARRWITIGFSAAELQRACRRTGGFTYSDLLATCALEVLREWNRKHVENSRPRVGLWLPMNIRRQSHSGFGNGTSRVRLYARYPASTSLVEKAREIRRQLSWSTTHGEWVVPEFPLLTRTPAWISAPLLRSYLNRPSIDMATAVFSHADRWAGGAKEAFAQVERIECVGLLHMRQSIAINGATHDGRTWMTFTYDTGLLRGSDVEKIAEMFRRLIGSVYESTDQ